MIAICETPFLSNSWWVQNETARIQFFGPISSYEREVPFFASKILQTCKLLSKTCNILALQTTVSVKYFSIGRNLQNLSFVINENMLLSIANDSLTLPITIRFDRLMARRLMSETHLRNCDVLLHQELYQEYLNLDNWRKRSSCLWKIWNQSDMRFPLFQHL